jgi:archaemetzincin
MLPQERFAEMRVTIVPIGQPDAVSLRMLAEDLIEGGFDATISDREQPPERAYEPSRRQYRADAFLDMLRRHRGERVLGVTDVDLYADGLNFVFGSAEDRGRAALISLGRLGADADPAKARARALKEAVHELGHTIGLGHCDVPGCVMHFSNCLADTDRKGGRFCASCRDQVRRLAQR